MEHWDAVEGTGFPNRRISELKGAVCAMVLLLFDISNPTADTTTSLEDFFNTTQVSEYKISNFSISVNQY